MPKVVVSIPKLGVKAKGTEKGKEIYVLGLAADNSRSDKIRQESFPIAAYNETLPNIAPEIMSHSFLNYFICSASNIFERITPQQPVSLSGSGIILYPNLDPEGLLALHFVIIESDYKTRNLGKVLNDLFTDSEVDSLVKKLSKTVKQEVIASIFNVLAGQIPKILKKNKDDVLFAHSHSGFDFDYYGISSPDKKFEDFDIGNNRAFCTLRIRVID